MPTIDTSLRPFEAVRAVRRLLANPEDTSQVFAIFRALRGRSGLTRLPPFCGQPHRRQVIREKRRVCWTRCRTARGWRRCRTESFGRSYFNFMEEEQLTAEGLVAGLAELGDRSRACGCAAVPRAHARRP